MEVGGHAHEAPPRGPAAATEGQRRRNCKVDVH